MQCRCAMARRWSTAATGRSRGRTRGSASGSAEIDDAAPTAESHVRRGSGIRARCAASAPTVSSSDGRPRFPRPVRRATTRPHGTRRGRTGRERRPGTLRQAGRSKSMPAPRCDSIERASRAADGCRSLAAWWRARRARRRHERAGVRVPRVHVARRRASERADHARGRASGRRRASGIGSVVGIAASTAVHERSDQKRCRRRASFSSRIRRRRSRFSRRRRASGVSTTIALGSR